MIKSRVSTTVKKQKIDIQKFLQNVRGASTSYVTIGLHEDAGRYTDGKNPPSVVQVGLWTEFGTEPHDKHPGTPEYAWLRKSVDNNERLINQWREEAMENILFKGWTLDKALEMMGFRIMTLVQNTIKSNLPPANRPSTVAAKASHGLAPNTLIDTGLMLRSVTFKVVMA